jgi:hypothetical protein
VLVREDDSGRQRALRYCPSGNPSAVEKKAAFVLRVRVEAPGPKMGPPRMHFRCEEVGTRQTWRFTDLDRVFEKLRARIDELLLSPDS